MPAGRRTPATRVAIALGSNLGDRAAHLDWAIAALAQHLTELRTSPYEETAPVEVPDHQPDYLNAVAVGRTRLDPHALLDVLLGLEAARGRTRVGERAARTLDLDLVLYGDRVIDDRPPAGPAPAVPGSPVRSRAARRAGASLARAGQWTDAGRIVESATAGRIVLTGHRIDAPQCVSVRGRRVGM